jgi:imidazolonepropionase-like amidohydrolase
VLFAVSSEQDVDLAWRRLLAGHPDFVKVFLVHSDEYAARLHDPTRSPKDRGIDPALVPGIVRRAHAAGLRVSAHIENAHDFHVAVASGVDDIAHLPFVDAANLEAYRLADVDVRAAGARRATVATTLDWASGASPEDPRVRVERDNLARLRRSRVRIIIGTDLFRQTARVEVELIVRLRLMSNLEILKAWSETTPQAIFPSRAIGQFHDGAEASFLVLNGNPLVDPARLHVINRRVKLGKRVVVHEEAIKFPPLPE